MAETQFITNEQGERIGVILDLPTYHQLVHEDPELLKDLNEAELKALANSKLSSEAQARLEALQSKQVKDELTESEVALLDSLIDQIDQLNILKARAKYTLKMQSNSE